MLSLKGRGSLAHSARSFLHLLPSELVDGIVHLLGTENHLAETLGPVSLVCKTLCPLAQALLFDSVNVVFSRRFLWHDETLIDFLICRPHLRRHVKHVAIREPLELRRVLYKEDVGEVTSLEKLIPLLPNLRSIRLHQINNITVSLVNLVRSDARDIHLVVSGIPYVTQNSGQQDQKRLLTQAKEGETSESDWLEVLSDVTNCPSVSIGLRGIVDEEVVASINPLLISCQGLKALNYPQIDPKHLDCAQTQPEALSYATSSPDKSTCASKWEKLEELHIDNKVPSCFQTTDQPQNSIATSWLRFIRWEQIKRLSVEGNNILDFLVHAVPYLSSLRALRVSSECLRDGSFERLCASTPSPFGRLTRLKELELDQVTNKLSIESFANPGLRYLKIHHGELNTRRGIGRVITEHDRSPDDLKKLARLCPLIEHLEIDIGEISHLWHPTAIPGVDVDVRIYGVLAALAAFPHVKHIRLFPPYLQRISARPVWTWPGVHQPADDEQVIKIFKYLRSQCLSLQTLAISSDNHLAGVAIEVEFYAMCWDVHILGSQTILSTRQAGKDYEQRQIWEGERRLTTEIRRLIWEKPYLDGPKGWILDH